MTASMACFVAGDALVKLSGETIPMSQVIFVRSICGAILLLCLGVVLRTPHFGRTLSDRRVLARIRLDAGATIGFPFELEARDTGTYWFDVAYDDALLTRIPLVVERGG